VPSKLIGCLCKSLDTCLLFLPPILPRKSAHIFFDQTTRDEVRITPLPLSLSGFGRKTSGAENFCPIWSVPIEVSPPSQSFLMIRGRMCFGLGQRVTRPLVSIQLEALMVFLKKRVFHKSVAESLVQIFSQLRWLQYCTMLKAGVPGKFNRE